MSDAPEIFWQRPDHAFNMCWQTFYDEIQKLNNKVEISRQRSHADPDDVLSIRVDKTTHAILSEFLFHLERFISEVR